MEVGVLTCEEKNELVLVIFALKTYHRSSETKNVREVALIRLFGWQHLLESFASTNLDVRQVDEK